MRLTIYVLIIFIVALSGSCGFGQMSGVRINSMDVRQLQSDLQEKKDVVLIDVRSEAEFNGSVGHLENAILIPLPELEQRYSELNEFKDKEIIVYCRSGNRSRTATKFLMDKGFKAVNLEGGILAWNRLK